MERAPTALSVELGRSQRGEPRAAANPYAPRALAAAETAESSMPASLLWILRHHHERIDHEYVIFLRHFCILGTLGIFGHVSVYAYSYEAQWNKQLTHHTDYTTNRLPLKHFGGPFVQDVEKSIKNRASGPQRPKSALRIVTE